MPGYQGTNFMVVIHRPAGEARERWLKRMEDGKLIATDGDVRYVRAQEEKGPNPAPGRTGHHVQMFLQTHDKKSFKGVNDIIQTYYKVKAGVQPVRGTNPQADHYCRKSKDCKTPEGGPCREKGCVSERDVETVTGRMSFVAGEMCEGQGHRTDACIVLKAVTEEGMSDAQVLRQYPLVYLQFGRQIAAARAIVAEEKERYAPSICCLLGPPDVGKSVRVRGHKEKEIPGWFARDSIYTTSGDEMKGTWFNGYNPLKHTCMLFEEFSGKHIPYTTLLRLLDEGDFSVPTKGGMVPFKCTHVVFTSNTHPSEWYPEMKECNALLTRLANVFHIESKTQKVPGPDQWIRGRVDPSLLAKKTYAMDD